MNQSSEYKDCSYNELYALQVLDESMEPEFPKGCVVVIEPSQTCATGAYVVISVGEERWFRQFVQDESGSRKLVALHEGFHEIPLDDKDYLIEGVIVQRNIKREVKHYKPYLPNNGEG
jgi:SOS-response transcriptional repressor LexA